MAKWLHTAILFILLTAPVAAGTYSTVLYTDDLDEHFRISGWANAKLTAEDRVSLNIKYTVRLIDSAFNKTTIDGFEARVMNDTSVVETRDLQTFSLNYDQSKTKYDTFEFDISPDQVHELHFRANHTPVLAGGGTTNHSVKASIGLSVTTPNESLDEFDTNFSEVYRGEKLYVFGEASKANRLNISGQWVEVPASDNFSTWITVPEDIGTGIQVLDFNLTSERGTVFHRSLVVKVRNSAPEVTVSYPRQIGKNQTLGLTVDATDDSAVDEIEVRFDGSTMINSSGRFSLPTKTLPEGNYSFDVTVTDDAGKEAVLPTRNFTIAGETQQDMAGDPGQTGDDEDQSSEEADQEMSESIPIIGAIRSFITGIIESLLGAFM